MMNSAASLKMDDDIIEIEEEANTSTDDIIQIEEEANTPDRQALADSMKKSVKASVSKLRRGGRPTIYKVPQMIREVKEVAYEPKLVSIGPYHNGNERLKGMEENKWLYLDSFFSRNPDHGLEDYLKAMEELEDKARSCYSDNISPQSSNEFVKMMVLDACFVVEFLIKFNLLKQIGKLLKEKEQLAQKEKELEPEEAVFREKKLQELISQLGDLISQLGDSKDPILNTNGMMSLVGYDMFLLENQIPFFVLQRIFMMVCPENSPHKLAEMALDLFDQFMRRNKKIQIKDSCDQSKDSYCHLLHLFHSHLIPTPTHSKESNSTVESVPNNMPNLSSNHTVESVLNKLKNLRRFFPSSNKPQLPIRNNPSPARMMMIPCAAELQLVGVEFKKKEKYSSILDVEFSHGVLEIPPLLIQDLSDTLFRNLIAFEQCCLEETSHFTTYFWFMDCLINTSKDVALLHRNGIIDHLLGSDGEVAHLFNRLGIGIFQNINGSYLSDLKDNVQKHCENKWNKWRAILKRDYFTNPWSVISLIAASILLLLTIIQTFFSVFPYYRPRS